MVKQGFRNGVLVFAFVLRGVEKKLISCVRRVFKSMHLPHTFLQATFEIKFNKIDEKRFGDVCNFDQTTF